MRGLRTSAPRLAAGFAVVLAAAAWIMVAMPGRNPPRIPPLDAAGEALRGELRRDVVRLAHDIGERNVSRRPAELERAADFIRESLAAAGCGEVAEEHFEVQGRPCRNLWVELRGAEEPERLVVVGAHYDTVVGSPGANDNGTGTAALLALARRLAGGRPRRSLRLVAFANEEPPHFTTDEMGSAVHARGCRERGENVVVMLSLETIGCYSDEPGSQRFPTPLLRPFYSDVGNYLVWVGDLRSRRWVKRAVRTFRSAGRLPCEGAALPRFVPGVGWSDHASFWREGYPGVMATDTAPFRYPHYHTAEDTPYQVDYERFAAAVLGIEAVVRDWVGAPGI